MKAIRAIVKGEKPIGFLYDIPKVQNLIKKHKLSALSVRDDLIVFKEENREVAEFLFDIYLHRGQYPQSVYFFIVGVCLGYPIDKVMAFTSKNANDKDLLDKLSRIAHGRWLSDAEALTHAA